MQHLGTIMLSLDVLRAPSSVKLMRSAPLPDGTVTLLRIASGDEQLARRASAATGSPLSTIRDAAGFYIEQAMLHPEADSYRVLGARAEASLSELRRNMALLLRWLHPDHGVRERSVFAHRVTRAWNDLKTEERRAAYDRSRRLSHKSSTNGTGRVSPKSPVSKRQIRSIRPPYATPPRQSFRAQSTPGLLRKMLLLFLGRTSY